MSLVELMFLVYSGVCIQSVAHAANLHQCLSQIKSANCGILILILLQDLPCGQPALGVLGS